MIDEKKIEAAATSVAKETWNHEEEQFSFMDGFKAAVKWVQEEFVKSLWHDASEKPNLNTYCIGYYKDFSDCMVFYNPSDSAEWDTYVQYSSLSKWCYVDDILPKKGGEE